MKNLSLLLLILLLSSCAQVTLTMPYNPQTTEELSGKIKVGDFGYFPPEGIQQNEIPETAAGRIYLTEPVGEFITKAVKREFKQAGISSLGDNICSLDGEVNEFSLDSLGYSTDYTSDIRYILYDKQKKVLYDTPHKVEFNATKFVDASVIMANVNKVLSDNINKLLTDDEFQRNVSKSCSK